MGVCIDERALSRLGPPSFVTAKFMGFQFWQRCTATRRCTRPDNFAHRLTDGTRERRRALGNPLCPRLSAFALRVRIHFRTSANITLARRTAGAAVGGVMVLLYCLASPIAAIFCGDG